MNSVAQNWVKNYALALCARTLGLGIRDKFSDIPIPGDKVTLNGAALFSFYTSERDRLFKKLEDDLENLSYQKIMENRASVQDSISKTLGFNPMGIYVY